MTDPQTPATEAGTQMTNDLETRIEAETAAKLTRHNLRQAVTRLHDAAISIGNVRSLDLPELAEDELRTLQGQIEAAERRIKTLAEWQ